MLEGAGRRGGGTSEVVEVFKLGMQWLNLLTNNFCPLDPIFIYPSTIIGN